MLNQRQHRCSHNDRESVQKQIIGDLNTAVTAANTHKSITNNNHSINTNTRSNLNAIIRKYYWNGPHQDAQRLYHHQQKFRTINQTRHSFLLILIISLISLLCEPLAIYAINDSELRGVVRVSDDSSASDGNTSLDLVGSVSNQDANENAAAAAAASANSGGGSSGLYLDKIGSLEMSIAAVFNKVAYGTTTKRSIPDTVFIPNLTTVPTPQLTTFR